MESNMCPKCKWMFINMKDEICGFCKANKKIGINPVVIPQNKGDTPIDDLSDEEIKKFIKVLLGK